MGVNSTHLIIIIVMMIMGMENEGNLVNANGTTWSGSKYQIECTMCAACDNPCATSSPPPPSPPPPSPSNNCPPPPSPPSSGGNNYYSPPPPSPPSSGGNNYYYSPPPPGGSIGNYYPPPYNQNYPSGPTPPPPNPIVPYFPFYFYNPPPPSQSAAFSSKSSIFVNYVKKNGKLRLASMAKRGRGRPRKDIISDSENSRNQRSTTPTVVTHIAAQTPPNPSPVIIPIKKGVTTPIDSKTLMREEASRSRLKMGIDTWKTQINSPLKTLMSSVESQEIEPE